MRPCVFAVIKTSAVLSLLLSSQSLFSLLSLYILPSSTCNISSLCKRLSFTPRRAPVRTVLPVWDRAPQDENDGDVDGDDASTD